VQVQQNNWKWHTQTKIYQPQAYQIPHSIADVPDTIVKEILACQTCSKNYRITEQELKLYRKLNVTVPQYCFDCRYKRRFALRNPRQLWQRECMCTQIDHGHNGRCQINFATTYNPERQELIYCEKCYQKEAY
jgi:hypothetical protein